MERKGGARPRELHGLGKKNHGGETQHFQERRGLQQKGRGCREKGMADNTGQLNIWLWGTLASKTGSGGAPHRAKIPDSKVKEIKEEMQQGALAKHNVLTPPSATFFGQKKI